MMTIDMHVPYYGLAPGGSIKVWQTLQFFQEAATIHADSIGAGVRQLRERGVTWVLRRYRLSFTSSAAASDVSVSTWYEPHKNLLSVRRFEMNGPGGETLASGWSSWIALDLARMRPMQLDRALPQSYFNCAETVDEPDPPKLKMEELERAITREFRPRASELDTNGHTNHTVYIDWALETVPDEIAETMRPISIDAEYLRSVRRERVTSAAEMTSGGARAAFAHRMTEPGGAELFRAETVWEKMPISEGDE